VRGGSKPLGKFDSRQRSNALSILAVRRTSSAFLGRLHIPVNHGVTVKFVALAPVPDGVVMEMVPVLAPLGTVAVICVADTRVNSAFLLLANLTAVAPVKFVPVIVTTVPMGPLVGAKPLIVGGDAVTVKEAALVAVPPGVVTAIAPVVAPAGTFAMTCDEFLTTTLVLVTPLKLTLVVPVVKLVPLIVTDVPVGPVAGEKLEMVGAGPTVTVNEAALVAVPPGVVTAIAPVVAPAGTVAVIWVAELTV
jgi:hypothetical protein